MVKKIKQIILCSLAALIIALASSTAGLAGLAGNTAFAADIPQTYIKYTIKPGDSLYKISKAHGVSISSIKAANNLTSDVIYSWSVISIPAPGDSILLRNRALKDIIKDRGLTAGQVQIRLFVDKSDKLLKVYTGNNVLKAYRIELGDSGMGDKQVAGDHKTPEGSFYIAQKSILSPSDKYLGNRWMRLSYPNIEDAQRGLNSGLINKTTYDSIVNAINNGQIPPQNTALGGGIGIHGGSVAEFGPNWTWGCVGLTNKDVQDFYDYVKVGTKVTIQQ